MHPPFFKIMVRIQHTSDNVIMPSVIMPSTFISKAEELLDLVSPCVTLRSSYLHTMRTHSELSGFELKYVSPLQDEIQAGLRYVFQTNSKHVLLVSGTGHAGGNCCPKAFDGIDKRAHAPCP